MKKVFALFLKTSRVFARGAVRCFVFMLCFAGLTPGDAIAGICTYENANGQMMYSNLPPSGPGWKKRHCLPGAESPAPSSKTTSTKSRPRQPSSSERSALPKISAQKQRERDAMRRKVIEDELAAESKLLREARLAYADGSPPALPEEFLDPEKYLARIEYLRDSLHLHERNVDALKKEISKM